MTEQENLKAQQEAMKEPVSRALRSARRAQLWEGLNRYLASEASHARKVAREEKEHEAESGTASAPKRDTANGPEAGDGGTRSDAETESKGRA